MMKGRVILEFTLKGRRNTYFRRLSLFGEALTTTNKDSARKVKEKDAPGIIKKLIKQFGEDNIADIKAIKDGN